MMEKELTELQRKILDWMEIENSSPVTYAKEVGEIMDITSQKASGALRGLENRGFLVGQTIGAGSMHSTKVYYLPAVMDIYRGI